MKRIFGWLFILAALALLVGPYMVPVKPLEGVVDPRDLADGNSRFATVDGLAVHYQESGQGEPAFLLLHGFGASTFTWREVMDDFGVYGRTVAYDRTAFGLTERPVAWDAPQANPYSVHAQVSQGFGVLDTLGIDHAVLIGNSAGGRTALSLALARPERVRALVLVSPAVGMGGGSTAGWLKPLLHTPQMDRLGPWLVRRIASSGNEVLGRAWHDPTRLTPAVVAGYRKPLGARDWDRALWEFTRAPRDEPGKGGTIESRLPELASLPVLVITGDDDRVVPVAHSRAVADGIPGSRYVELAECGHVPQEECPDAFFSAVSAFLKDAGILATSAPEEAPQER
ncbi:MAG: alpha/beta hydrolase [Pseudomonadales bacterium]|nr:alpha/beta hydrolase [Pseudomonadales bacterium]MCP5183856.1 alpha/beta hydrolase [Pseudomonadales bacterium]